MLALSHAMAQDTESKWAENYLIASLGTKSEVDVASTDRRAPYLSLGIGSMTADYRRGRFLALNLYGNTGETTRQFTNTEVTPSGMIVFTDTMDVIDSRVFGLEVVAGRILPIKSWGEQHRLSWVPSIGYAYKTGEVTYPDNPSNEDGYVVQAHGLKTAIDLQYRYHLSEAVFLGTTVNLFDLNMSVRKDTVKPVDQLMSTFILDFDMQLINAIQVTVGIRI